MLYLSSSVSDQSLCVAIEVFNSHVFSVYSGRDYTCQWILDYLSELVVLEPSSTDLYLEAKVVGHAH